VSSKLEQWTEQALGESRQLPRKPPPSKDKILNGRSAAMAAELAVAIFGLEIHVRQARREVFAAASRRITYVGVRAMDRRSLASRA
jgi:hypothetical protein